MHEETLTWSVDSLVKVNPKRTAWAALVVHEENLDVDFEVTGLISFPLLQVASVAQGQGARSTLSNQTHFGHYLRSLDLLSEESRIWHVMYTKSFAWLY